MKLMFITLMPVVTFQSVYAADLLKTHVTGVINHGHGGFHSYIDINEYQHDPNLTINVILKTLKDVADRQVHFFDDLHKFLALTSVTMNTWSNNFCHIQAC